jgi:hypothetical protein
MEGRRREAKLVHLQKGIRCGSSREPVNFQGPIDDLNPERGKLKVMVATFGRMTPAISSTTRWERL